MDKKDIIKGDIYTVDFGKRDNDTTIMGKRPVVVVQNNTGNLYSPNVIVCSITSTHKEKFLPTHVVAPKGVGNLYMTSVVLTESLTTIAKEKLINYLGNVGELITEIDKALIVSLGLK